MADPGRSAPSSPAASYLALRARLLTTPSDGVAFEGLRTLLLSLRRFPLLVRWLESRTRVEPPATVGQAYLALANVLIAHPLHHGLAVRCCERAIELLGSASEAEPVRQFLVGLPKMVPQAQRELRAAAVEERDRRRAGQIYLQIAELVAVYDPLARDRLRENLERCFLLWPGMPGALDAVELLSAGRPGSSESLNLLVTQAGKTPDRAAAAELWVRAARGALKLGGPAERAAAQAHYERALQSDPTRLEALIALVETALDAQAPRAALALLEQTVSLSAIDAATRVNLWLFIAELQRQSGNLEGVRATLAELLRLPEAPLPELVRRAEQIGDARLVADCRRAQLAAADGAQAGISLPERLQRLRELAQLQAGELGQARDAFDTLVEALHLEPSRPELGEDLERLADAHGLELPLLAVYREIAGRSDAPVALLRRLAQRLTADRPAAALVWKRLLELAPGDAQASEALREEALPGASEAEQAASLLRELEAVPDSDSASRLRLLRQIVGLTHDPAQRSELLALVVALDGQDSSARRALLRDQLTLGAWEAAETSLAELLNGPLEDRERLALLRNRAAVLGKQGRLLEALPELEALLTAQPDDDQTRRLLETLVERNPTSLRAVQLLAEAELARGEPARAAALLMRAAELEGDGLLAVTALRRAARLFEEVLVDRRSALAALERALRLDPALGEVRQNLARVARELNAPGEAAELLLQLAESHRETDPEGVAMPSTELARQLASEARAPELEQRAAGLLLALRPHDPLAAGEAADRAVKLGKSREAVALLVARAQSLEGKQRAALLLQAGQLLLGELKDPENAIEPLRAALAEGANPGEALGPLADALAGSGRSREALEVMGREVGHWAVRGDPARAVRVGLRRARFAVEVAGDLALAVDVYRDVLSRRSSEPQAIAGLEALLSEGPARRPAALALAQVHEKNRDLPKLADALEVVADTETEVLPRAQLLRRLSQLYREDLRQPSHAFAVLARAARLQPRDQGLRVELLDLAREAELNGELVLLFEELADRLPRELAAPLLREAALVAEQQLADPPLARSLQEKALAIEPEHPESLAALYRLARAEGQTALAVELGERLSAVVRDPGQRVALLRDVAQASEALGEGFKAIELWHALLQEAPEDAHAAAELERLSEAYGVVTEKAEALARQLQQAGDVQSAAGRKLAVRLAQVRRAQADVKGALTLLARVLALEPAHPEALTLLEDWVQRSEGPAQAMADEAFALLDQALIAAGDGARRARALEARLERLGGAERLPLLLSLLNLLELGLGQTQRAFVLAGHAFLEFPGDPQLSELLDRLAAATDSADELAVLLESAANNSPAEIAGPLRAKLAQRAAQRDQPAEAARHWIELWRLAPQRDEAQPALDDLQETLKARPEALASLAGEYANALARVAPSEGLTVPLLRRVAELFDGPLANPEVAAQVYERWLEAEPGAALPLQSLVRIWRAVDNPEQLASALARAAQAEAGGSPERRALLLEVAILRERLSDLEGAMAAYREILAVDPRDGEALDRLATLLGTAHRWDELIVLLSQRAEQAELQGAAAEAVELKLHLAEVLLYQLGDHSGALGYLRAAVRAQPESSKAIQGLELILQRAERPADRAAAAELLEPLYAKGRNAQGLVAVLQARVEAAPAGAERAELQRQLAAVYLGPLNAPELAFVAASHALRADPEAPGAVALAVQAGERAQVAEELAQLLDEVAARVRQPAAFHPLHRALAILHAGPLKSGARAIAEWRKLIDQNPADAEAFEQLSHLYLANNDAASLLEMLRRQLAIAEDLPLRQALLHRIGELQADRQNDRAGALNTFRRLLELAPDDEAALQRFDGLAVVLQRWPELAPVLEREAQLAAARGDRGAQVDLLRRLGELRETALRDIEGAVQAYGQLLSLAPDDEATLARLEAVLEREPQNGSVAELLERVYKGAQNWGKVSAALEARASAIADPQARREVWLELAKLREERLGRPDLAFLALARAFRDDPGEAAVRQELERVAGLAEADEELVGVYEEELEHQARPEVVAALALRLGLIFAERVPDPARALSLLERARAVDPGAAAPGLPALERLYRERQDWPKLADVLDELVALASEPQERAGLLFRLGQLAEERLESPDRAALAYEALRQLDPRHLPGLRALERLYEQAGRSADLLAVLEQQQQLSPEGAGRDRLTARIADVAAHQLGDDQRAIQLWAELLQKNPRHELALSGIEAGLERLERWEDLAEFLRRRLKSTVDPREIARLNDKLGGLLGSRLGRAEDAISSFRAVLERDPRNRRALEALRDLHAARGENEELAAVLRRLIPIQEDALGVKAVRLQLAEVLAGLGRREEAIEAARRALDLEPHTLEEVERAERLFSALNAHAEVARAMETRATLYGPDQRAEAIAAYLGVADLYEGPLKKPEGGASALEKVFALEPGNQRAFESLKRIYTKTGDFRRYCALLDKLADQSQQQDPDPALRVVLLRELALIQEQKLGQKDLAFLALCRAFQAQPLDVGVAGEMRRLARETGALEELAEVYLNVIEQLGAAPETEVLLLQLAEIQDRELDDPNAAEESLRRLLAWQPGQGQALNALAELFRRRGRSREYVVALEQKAEQVAGLEEKKQVLGQLAAAYDELLEEPDEAVQTLRRGLELDPADRALTDQLAKLYRRERAFPDLASLLQRAREIASEPAERSRIQLQIAEILEVELKDDEGALSAYHLALELDPASLASLQALERLYTKLDRAAELLRVFDRQLEVVPTAERARVLFKAAQVWEEKLQNPANAIACLEGVLEVDPGNLRALRELARLYREAEDFERLASTLERHIQVATQSRAEHQDLVALHVALGDVNAHQLGRAQEGERLYLRALEIDPTGQPALRALGNLYEAKEHWTQALEMIRREVRLAASAEAAVELYSRAGRIQELRLKEPGEAENAYRRAMEIDPSALLALQGLKRIYAERQEWDNYLSVAQQEASVLPRGLEKTERLFELGRFHQETREDTAAAEGFYREALAVTPDYLPAARPLSDIFVARGDWDQAEAVLEVVVAKLSAEQPGEDPRELCRQQYRLGYVAEKLDHAERALAAYGRAYELDATYLPALEGLGNLLVRRQQFDEALKIFQAILIHHREELTDLEVVEIYWQIGEIHRGLQQAERAQKSFQRALEIDPGHEPSHEALAELFEAAGNFEGALEHRQKLLDSLEGEARFDASVQVARLSRDRLEDPYQAIDAFAQALKIRPDSLAVLEDLLALYRSTKQAQQALETLNRMLAHPEIQADPKAQRDLHFQLATLLRDDLKNDPGAIEHFNQALDADPAFLEAFAALEGLLTDRQDWNGLEQSYHAMLKRLPKTPETHQARMALWRTLGELYHRVLKNPEGAALAYEVVFKAEPENGQVAELLSDLYAAMPGKEREAIETSRVALRVTTDPIKVVKTLVRLHASLKDYDKAYVAAQVVVHLLGERSPDEEQIILRLKRFAKEQASRPLGDRQWADGLYHERLRGPLGEILALCQESTGGAYGVDHTRLNINRKKDRVDVQSSMLFFANMFKYVARTLALESLELFKVQGGSGLALGNTFPVCVVAGEDMFKDRPKRELWFVIAKALAFSRPELAMVRLHPAEELEATVQAAMSLAIPGFRTTANPELLAREQKRLAGSLSEAARPALFRVAREAARDPACLDLRPYLEAAEHTANRAGVLLAGDVETAMRCLSQDPGAAVRLPLRSKVRDLMLFCLSDSFSRLRQSLGLAVEVKLEGRATP